jgi:hypothetical protein
MKLGRFSVEGLLAILLTASVVWLMVACISLCSSHCAEPEEYRAVFSAKEIGGAHESDCCPITNAPASLKPERLFLDLQTSNADQTCTPAATQLHSWNHPRFGKIEVPNPSSSPPLSQLCVLRI